MSSKKIMVAISAGDWEGVQHRPHHFMNRAAANGRTVIYVEPPVSLIAPLKNRALIKNWKRWLKGPRKYQENLYVLSPPPTIPFGNKYRAINKINQWMLSISLKKAIAKFEGELELYSFLPSSVDLLEHLDFKKIYYDCVDDHASFTGLINPAVVHEMERELMEQSDVCFATANQLLEDRKEWSSNFHLIQNGAEFHHFATVQSETLPIPEDISGVDRSNVVGFIGGISDWIDLKIIEDAARMLPSVTFIMIGPVDTNIESMKKLANIHFLGAKPYKELPNYIQNFDVCLIPFKINKLTLSVNPIKMYEYLSAGKPIISTPLPEVVHFRDVIEIVKTADELVSSLNEVLENKEKYNTEEQIKNRQKVGMENSWDSRWETAERFMDQV